MSQLSPLQCNARDLEADLNWFAQVLAARIQHYFANDAHSFDTAALAPPALSPSGSGYARFVQENQLSFAERCTLLLALSPHVRPRLLDIFFIKNQKIERRFTEFGGYLAGANGDFTPTGETLAFIVAGDDLVQRFALGRLFEDEHVFARQNILRLAAGGEETGMKAPLRLSDEALNAFTTGALRRPDFGANFPARRIETSLNWDDLVLQSGTRKVIEEIKTWVEHGATLMHGWGMAKKLRPGYRSLFYGPPGTGKTMTACLLGKATGQDVYKIDLSQVVSKYIGETEKNLGKVFDQAQSRGWILFFDEADALFGKRSETKDSHDRYANQEVSFLLQRIESFDGIAILASNQRANMDDAFARRFESMVFFPIPRPEERLRLWQQGFSAQSQLESTLDLEKIAHEHALAGGAIMNVIRYASLEAIKHQRTTIATADVLQGIRREYGKEGKGT
ncbi:MAG: hypothetical protein RL748_1423 [Pseudomonadota bacterium]